MSFDELLKDLQDEKSLQRDPNRTTLDELFHDSFMSKHSKCKNFKEFLEKGNFQAKSKEDLIYIEGELLDRHVVRETEFADWKSMLDAANKEAEAR